MASAGALSSDGEARTERCEALVASDGDGALDFLREKIEQAHEEMRTIKGGRKSPEGGGADLLCRRNRAKPRRLGFLLRRANSSAWRHG